MAVTFLSFLGKRAFLYAIAGKWHHQKSSSEQQAALQALQRMKQGQSRHAVEQKWYQHLSPKLEKTMA